MLRGLQQLANFEGRNRTRLQRSDVAGRSAVLGVVGGQTALHEREHTRQGQEPQTQPESERCHTHRGEYENAQDLHCSNSLCVSRRRLLSLASPYGNARAKFVARSAVLI
jgi:hypothetical protein